MMILQRAIAVFGFAGLVLAPTAAFSAGHGTPDESPPAQEAVCDGQPDGVAYGLCVASASRASGRSTLPSPQATPMGNMGMMGPSILKQSAVRASTIFMSFIWVVIA